MLNAFVYIVESPSDDDVLEGRSEGRSLCESLKLAGIDHEYCPVATRKTFNKALNAKMIEAITRRDGKFPILHLSTHGNKDGLGLTDGTVLTWAELRAELQGLTMWSTGKLLIGISSCHGYWGIRMAMFEGEDHPFGGIVANSENALWNDAAVAFVTFYHLLFKGRPIEHCVEAMKMASDDPNFYFERGDTIKANWAKSMENWNEVYAQFVRDTAPKPPSNGLLFGLEGLPGLPAPEEPPAPEQGQNEG